MNYNHDTGTIDTIQTIDTTSLPPLGGTAGVLTIQGVGAIVLAGGTTLNRPASPVQGMIRSNSDLSVLEGYNGTSWLDLTKQGTVTSVTVSGSTGISTSGGPVTSSGTITLTLGAELAGFSSLSTNGIVARTGAGVYAGRTIGGTAGNIVLTNGDGVSGNPTVNLATVGAGGTSVGSSTAVPVLSYDTFGRVTAAVSTNIAFPVTSVFGRTGVVSAVAGDYTLGQIGTVSLSAPAAGNVLTYNGSNWINAAPATAGTVTSIAATGSTGLTVGGSPITSSGTLTFTLSSELQGLSGLGTSGVVVRTGAGTYTGRTIAGTAGTIAVSNGDGIAGNPTITLATVTAGAGGTFQKFTTDTFGRVSAVSNVVASDITTLVDATYVNVTGDSMSGDLTFTGGATVKGLPLPTLGTDAANKNYVDAAVTGLSWKQAVRAATTANITLSGAQTIDGVSVIAGDRVLVKNQTTASQNGIYVAAAGAWARAADADASAEYEGQSVFVEEGTVAANSGWVQTADNVTLGTTSLVYSQFSGSGTYTAGTGLTLTGNTFSLTSPVAVSLGGTGLTTLGAANTVLGVNAGGTAYEAKAITAGTGVSVTNGAGTITVANTGVLSFTQTLPSFLSQAGASAATGAVSSTITLATQTTNTVFAAPNGSTGTPTFRTLAYADLPIKLYVENPSTPTTPLAAGTNAVAIGSGSSASGAASLALGAGSLATLANSKAYANGSFASAGDAQSLEFVMRQITSSATTAELFLDGVTGTLRAALPNNSLWNFQIMVAARRTDATGGGAGYRFQGVIRRDANAASTAFVGTPAKTILGETNVGWDAAVAADTTNGSLRINVTGEAAKTIRWVATVSVTQVLN